MLNLDNSNLNISGIPTEEDIKADLIVNLISDKDNYINADKECLCSKCEVIGMCNCVNKSQRFEREQGGLGLCHKLNEFTFYDFVESHFEKYKLIVDTRREKRNYIEVELLPILQRFDSSVISTEYRIYYHEEFLDVTYTDKRVRLYITATSIEGIKKLVDKKLLNHN